MISARMTPELRSAIDNSIREEIADQFIYAVNKIGDCNIKEIIHIEDNSIDKQWNITVVFNGTIFDLDIEPLEEQGFKLKWIGNNGHTDELMARFVIVN